MVPQRLDYTRLTKEVSVVVCSVADVYAVEAVGARLSQSRGRGERRPESKGKAGCSKVDMSKQIRSEGAGWKIGMRMANDDPLTSPGPYL